MQFHDFFSNSYFLGYRYIITRESIRNCTPQSIWKEKYMCLGHDQENAEIIASFRGRIFVCVQLRRQ